MDELPSTAFRTCIEFTVAGHTIRRPTGVQAPPTRLCRPPATRRGRQGGHCFHADLMTICRKAPLNLGAEDGANMTGTGCRLEATGSFYEIGNARSSCALASLRAIAVAASDSSARSATTLRISG